MECCAPGRTLLGDYSPKLIVDVDTYQANETFLNKFVEPGEGLGSPLSFGSMRRWVAGGFVEIPEDELNEIHYPEKVITLCNSETDVSMTFENENGFTADALFSHIITFENESRPKTEWFGGIDAHHIYFEGLSWLKENTFEIVWGS